MNQNLFKLSILKLDHRPARDKRITTHCSLVSRTFGASDIYYSGVEDLKLENNIKNIVDKWGGNFKINYIEEPLEFVENLKEKKYNIVHLTMYGLNILNEEKKLKEIASKQNTLIIVGGPKVPKEYYELADYNIAVGNQPHSEIAAITLLLYLLKPDFIKNHKFENSKININPNNNYKDVINKKIKK